MVDMNTNDVIDLDNDILLSEQKSCIESLKKKIAKWVSLKRIFRLSYWPNQDNCADRTYTRPMC